MKDLKSDIGRKFNGSSKANLMDLDLIKSNIIISAKHQDCTYYDVIFIDIGVGFHRNGVNLKIIQELLGHESIMTTLIYAHLAPDNKFQAVNVLDKIFSDDKSVTNMLPFLKHKAV